MKHLYVLGLFLIVGLTAFGQSINGTIMHDDEERDYRLYIPNSYDGGEAVPLLFNLHGLGSNKEEQELYGDFRPIADTANFIIVHPNGSVTDGTRFWNAFDIPGFDDVGFLVALIDSLSEEYVIDSTRIYSTGMSNGGFMSYELACVTENRFAAVASVTGAMDEERMDVCTPNRPIPTLSIHGTEDEVVPYYENPEFASVPEILNHWSLHINADEEPFVMALPDLDETDGSTVEHHIYPNGNRGKRVEHFKVIGGGHTWPGTSYGQANQDIDASVEVWKFFRQFSLQDENLTPLTVTQTTGITCPGDEDAVLEVTSTEDISDYTFTWTDGDGNTLGTGMSLTVGAGLYHAFGSKDDTSTFVGVYVVNDPIIIIEGEIEFVSSDSAYIEILAEGGTGEYTYSWVGPNDFSATTQNITVGENGEYTLTITDENGCQEEASFTVETLSIKALTKQNTVNVFPNPSKTGIFTVKTNEKITHLEVVDVLGKRVLMVEPQSEEVKFSLKNNGIYFAKITTLNGQANKKIIVK